MAYSNANYAILARVVEITSGLDYGEFLQTAILTPLALDSTGHRGPGAPPVDRLASGFSLVGTTDLAPSRYLDYTVFTGSGSIFSTTADLERWYRLLHTDALLQPESRALMFSEHVDGRGYGWTLETWYGRAVVAMAGWDGVGFSLSSRTFRTRP